MKEDSSVDSQVRNIWLPERALDWDIILADSAAFSM